MDILNSTPPPSVNPQQIHSPHPHCKHPFLGFIYLFNLDFIDLAFECPCAKHEGDDDGKSPLLKLRSSGGMETRKKVPPVMGLVLCRGLHRGPQRPRGGVVLSGVRGKGMGNCFKKRFMDIFLR